MLHQDEIQNIANIFARDRVDALKGGKLLARYMHWHKIGLLRYHGLVSQSCFSIYMIARLHFPPPLCFICFSMLFNCFFSTFSAVFTYPPCHGFSATPLLQAPLRTLALRPTLDFYIKFSDLMWHKVQIWKSSKIQSDRLSS